MASSWTHRSEGTRPTRPRTRGADPGPEPDGGRPGGQSVRSTTTGTWSDAPLPLRSSRSIVTPVTRAGGGRQVREVDAHALVPWEPQPLVVPVRVGALGRDRLARDLGVPGGAERGEGVPLGGRDVRLPGEVRDVPHVGGAVRRSSPRRARPAPPGRRRASRRPARAARRASAACRRSAGRRPRARAARRGSTRARPARRAERARLDPVAEGGLAGNDVSTSARPTRETTATPFHWFTPTCATSYPAASNGATGNCASVHLVSWSARTSVPVRSRNATARSTRARTELMFQVARRTGPTVRRRGCDRPGNGPAGRRVPRARREAVGPVTRLHPACGRPGHPGARRL